MKGGFTKHKKWRVMYRRIEKILLYADIIRRLGIRNVAYIVWYRFTMKTGLRRRFFLQKNYDLYGDFFHPIPPVLDYPEGWKKGLFTDAKKILNGNLRYYARHWRAVGTPPDWFLNPFNNTRHPKPHDHWTLLKDFEPSIGDIKNIWEASRFEWVVTLARAYRVSGETLYLETVNRWLLDWWGKNPINTGPNWKCGQEAAIRVLSLLQAALILGQWECPSPVLTHFVFLHLERIHANIRYALAQDNNHGTSESAALFLGGHWLLKTHKMRMEAEKSVLYARHGRKWFENRIIRLVEPDGSFSQHSVTYHRLLLDTILLVRYWEKKLEVQPFSDQFYARCNAALHWMNLMMDPISGSAPNLGANDGTFLLNTHACDYRDFRPTLQAAASVFNGKRAFGSGPWDESLYWFDMKPHCELVVEFKKVDMVLPCGYIIMTGKKSWGMLRFPMYRFRPGHNDVFHFDLWYEGQNVLRDAGSFSYNPEQESDAFYFQSTMAHNTVSFDGGEQMPRLGRFMLAKWIRAEHIGDIKSSKSGSCVEWTGAYRDWKGNRHQRSVLRSEDHWTIEDRLSGPFERAQIVYRLIPLEYKIEGSTVIAPWGYIEIVATGCRILIGEGAESLYYWEKQPVTNLVLTIGKSTKKIVTRFVFKNNSSHIHF